MFQPPQPQPHPHPNLNPNDRSHVGGEGGEGVDWFQHIIVPKAIAAVDALRLPIEREHRHTIPTASLSSPVHHDDLILPPPVPLIHAAVVDMFREGAQQELRGKTKEAQKLYLLALPLAQLLLNAHKAERDFDRCDNNDDHNTWAAVDGLRGLVLESGTREQLLETVEVLLSRTTTTQ
jgi:hypothetical protein